MHFLLAIVVVLAFAMVVQSFAPRAAKYQSSTKLFENFNLDFANPEIESNPLIFTEKQLREYTAEYSVDNRINPLEFVINLFKKSDDAEEEEVEVAATPLSFKELEDKTGNFIEGNVDAKAFYAILQTAFGKKLSGVLPEILRNLPAKKSAELKKVAK